MSGAPSDPLAGASLKLARGEEHLTALNAEIEGWLQEHPYLSPHEVDEDGGVIYWVELTEVVPPRFGIIVGDWAHNVRSALDHLAWELVRLHGGRTGRHVAFPISVAPEHWDQNVEHPVKRRSMLDGIPIGSASFVGIKKLQPYQGRNEADARVTELGTLAMLNNLDKHQAIHSAVTTRADALPEVVFEPADAVGMIQYAIFVQQHQPLAERTKLVRARPYYAPGRHDELEHHLEFTVGIVFAEQGVAFGGLGRIQRYVADIVDSLRRTVFEPEPGFVPLWDR